MSSLYPLQGHARLITFLFIDRLAWAVAQNANSASCFVRTLLTAVFPIDVLLVSNLRGTSRDSGPQCQALDRMKVDAIYSKFQISSENCNYVN